jgi:hypothetical protein
MSIKTQGTHLYFKDGTSVIQVGCVTSISGVSASRDQIEVTCLEDLARSYESGMVTPGAVTFGITFDPSENSHINLHDLYVSGESTFWAIGWSDGDDAPELDTEGEFSFPTNRTFLEFNGYVSDLPFEFALSAMVTSSITVQMSGFPQLIPKTTNES